MSDGLIVERENGVLRLTFDRPERLNALTGQMVAALTEEIERSNDRVIVITGRGRAFCTGADVSGITADTVGAAVDAASGLVRAIMAAPRPVVAAVNGPAAGVGCAVALACDVTVAHESSYFLLAFANIGLMPDGGSTAIVAASIGRARALRMALLAEPISANEAAQVGLIGACVDEDDYPSQVAATVDRLAQGPTLSYARSKEAINAATLTDVESAFVREREGQVALLRSADAAEGLAAFLAKRRPDFSGR